MLSVCVCKLPDLDWRPSEQESKSLQNDPKLHPSLQTTCTNPTVCKPAKILLADQLAVPIASWDKIQVPSGPVPDNLLEDGCTYDPVIMNAIAHRIAFQCTSSS